MTEMERTSAVYSRLGRFFLDGSVEVAKFFYKSCWGERPPLIRTITDLQGHLTAVEVEKDKAGKYSAEFLYYWAMTCIGEQSPLIFKDLGTAEVCLKKILPNVPIAEARLAYIALLRSTEPAKSENNVVRLDVLRRWANKNDLFSRIVLAKIVFYSFLQERQTADPENNPEPPLYALRSLDLPCRKGHPVAIRFWNDVCACLENPGNRFDERSINDDVLLDYKTAANMQIRP